MTGRSNHSPVGAVQVYVDQVAWSTELVTGNRSLTVNPGTEVPVARARFKVPTMTIAVKQIVDNPTNSKIWWH